LSDNITSRELFQHAFAGEKTEKIPIWFMRQAGRYLPEYMALSKNRTFEDRVQNPEIAAEITLQPIQRYDLDAAIIFSDILIPIYGMNRGLEIVPTKGPQIENPIKYPKDVDNLVIPTADEEYPYLEESIKLVRSKIQNKALIGFSGAPFTLASYLIEGQSTKTANLTKAFAYNYPGAFHKLMNILVDIIIEQLKVQIKGGVDFIQIFDSWAGFLSPQQFQKLSLPYLDKIFNEITEVPKLLFSRGSYHILPVAKSLSISGFSVDQSITISQAHTLLPKERLIQGNLDPAFLLTKPKIVKEETSKILNSINELHDLRYIFNLGVGIDKNSTLENVAAMVETVQNFRRRVHE
jgi:uroporphyrinogen decarboxylase